MKIIQMNIDDFNKIWDIKLFQRIRIYLKSVKGLQPSLDVKILCFNKNRFTGKYIIGNISSISIGTRSSILFDILRKGGIQSTLF